jgi:hypothetical protein
LSTTNFNFLENNFLAADAAAKAAIEARRAALLNGPNARAAIEQGKADAIKAAAEDAARKTLESQ